MRTIRNRIMHALAFEGLGLAMITPLAAIAMAKPLHEIGIVTLVSTLLATGWTYFYNLIFDHALMWLRGSPVKTPALRLLHTALFEGGLLAIIVPFVAWWLDIGWMQALMLDLAFAAFYLVYALGFNWVWDRIFPYQLPGPAQAG